MKTNQEILEVIDEKINRINIGDINLGGESEEFINGFSEGLGWIREQIEK